MDLFQSPGSNRHTLRVQTTQQRGQWQLFAKTQEIKTRRLRAGLKCDSIRPYVKYVNKNMYKRVETFSPPDRPKPNEKKQNLTLS